jgi:chorismate mutase
MKKWLRYFLFVLLLTDVCRQGVAQVKCDFPGKKQSHRSVAAQGDLENLGRLMDARLAVMQDVARYKWNMHAQIEDPVREQKLLDSVRSQSEGMGLPSEWTLHFFREQIEAAKLVQYQLFAQWRKEHQGAFADAPDLSATIRPQLDALTPQLLQAISKSWPKLVAGDGVIDSIGDLKASRISTCAAQLAILPFVDGSIQAQ